MDFSAQTLLITRLLDEFDLLIHALNPYDVDYPVIFKKAKVVEAKMNRFYIKWGKPPEMLEHIQKMDSIIKKIEKKQNNHVTDM